MERYKHQGKTVNVDHQLIYKNLGDGCKFHISTPKTQSSIRIIPMTQEVAKAFEEQRKINFMLAKDKSIEVDGYSGVVFTAKSGRPLMPNGVKVLQYIMGHAHIDVTMEVYNHIGELTRIENEIARLDNMILKGLQKINKNISTHLLTVLTSGAIVILLLEQV